MRHNPRTPAPAVDRELLDLAVTVARRALRLAAGTLYFANRAP
jgi:hypothetical protein